MKKQIFVQLLFIVALGFIFSQCTWNEYPDVPIDIQEDVSFELDIIPIFNASCNSAGCHNAGGIAPDLSEANAYDALTTGAYYNLDTPAESELYQWMSGNRSIPMPLSGADAAYNALVLQWITEGALDN